MSFESRLPVGVLAESAELHARWRIVLFAGLIVLGAAWWWVQSLVGVLDEAGSLVLVVPILGAALIVISLACCSAVAGPRPLKVLLLVLHGVPIALLALGSLLYAMVVWHFESGGS